MKRVENVEKIKDDIKKHQIKFRKRIDENSFIISMFEIAILLTMIILLFILFVFWTFRNLTKIEVDYSVFINLVQIILFLVLYILLWLLDEFLEPENNNYIDIFNNDNHYSLLFSLDCFFILIYIIGIKLFVCQNNLIRVYHFIIYSIGTILFLFFYLKVLKDETRKMKNKYVWMNRHKFRRYELVNKWGIEVAAIMTVGVIKDYNFNDNSLKFVWTILGVLVTSIFAEQSIFIKHIENVIKAESDKEIWNKKVDRMIKILKKYNLNFNELVMSYENDIDSKIIEKNVLEEISKFTNFNMTEIYEVIEKFNICIEMEKDSKLNLNDVEEKFNVYSSLTGLNKDAIRKIFECSEDMKKNHQKNKRLIRPWCL